MMCMYPAFPFYPLLPFLTLVLLSLSPFLPPPPPLSALQYRMAGLAALDVMQQVVASWQAMDEERRSGEEGEDGVERVGEEEEEGEDSGLDIVHLPASRRGKAAASGPVGAKGRSVRVLRDWAAAEARRTGGREGMRGRKSKGVKLIKGWRDLFNSIIRWRQVSEPADTVTWIDQLK